MCNCVYLCVPGCTWVYLCVPVCTCVYLAPCVHLLVMSWLSGILLSFLLSLKVGDETLSDWTCLRWSCARAITPKENIYLTLTLMCYTLMSRSNKYRKYIPQQQNSHVLIIFSCAPLQTFWQCVCSVWLKTFDELTKKRRILHFFFFAIPIVFCNW